MDRFTGPCPCGYSDCCEFASVVSSGIPEGREVRIGKKSLLFDADAEADGAYVLCSGSIRLTGVDRDGEQRIVDIVWPGQVFGLDCLLDERRRLWAAVAREDSVAHCFRYEEVCRALTARPDLLWKTMLMLNRALHRSVQEKLLVTGGRIRDRVLNVLDSVERREQSTGCIRRLTQTEMAQMLGVRQESVCRELDTIPGSFRVSRRRREPMLAGISRGADPRPGGWRSLSTDIDGVQPDLPQY